TVFIQTSHRRERRLDRSLPLAKDGKIQGKIAERDRADGRAHGHERIRAVKRGQREKSEREARHAFAQSERSILGVKLLEQRAISLKNQRPEVEQLHFLDVR